MAEQDEGGSRESKTTGENVAEEMAEQTGRRRSRRLKTTEQNVSASSSSQVAKKRAINVKPHENTKRSRIECETDVETNAAITDPNSVFELVVGGIDVRAYREAMADPRDGALVTFEGVTRDTYEDKTVLSLEYEAYPTMVVRTMTELIRDVRTKMPEVKKICIVHRLGTCPVGETSLFVAVTSVHRAPAFHAVPYIVDELKRRAPIWKLEKYDQGPAQWKQNAEWMGGAAATVADAGTGATISSTTTTTTTTTTTESR